MLAQYTAASLVSESKSLAHPASVDSITSSAGQEDHVSMGMIAGAATRETSSRTPRLSWRWKPWPPPQALDLRAPLVPAPGTEAARAVIRDAVPHLDADRELGPDIDATLALVRTGSISVAAERAIGPLD